MFRILSLVTIGFFVLQHVCAQQYGSFKDSRDGKVYKTVTISGQEWMAEDLTAKTFLNGDQIDSPNGTYTFEENSIAKKPAFCNSRIGNSILYNSYAIVDNSGLCPVDWHIPTMTDWNRLSKFLGGAALAGRKMKSKSGWGTISEGGARMIICPNCKSWSDEYKRMVPCHTCKGNRRIEKNVPLVKLSANGNNQSGFNAFPTGGLNCGIEYLFTSLEPYKYTEFWSSEADYRSLFYSAVRLDLGNGLTTTSIKNTGAASVRCVKNLK